MSFLPVAWFPCSNFPCSPAGVASTPLETSTHSAKGIVGLCSFTVPLFASFLSLKTTIPSSFRKPAVTEDTRGATLAEGTSLSKCNAIKNAATSKARYSIFLTLMVYLSLLFFQEIIIPALSCLKLLFGLAYHSYYFLSLWYVHIMKKYIGLSMNEIRMSCAHEKYYSNLQ